MPTITQRIASAFTVLCGQYDDVTKMAQDREQSRQLLYREANQVVKAIDGAAAQSRIDEPEREKGVRREKRCQAGEKVSGTNGTALTPTEQDGRRNSEKVEPRCAESHWTVFSRATPLERRLFTFAST